MTAATAFHNSLWGSTGLIEGGRVHSLILISWFSQFLSWSMRWFSFFFFDSLQAHLKSSIPQFVSVFCWCFSVLLHSHPEAETSASRCKHAQRKDVHIPLLTWVYGWWIWLDYIIRPPWQKKIPPSIHSHCSNFTEAVIQRANIEKASQVSSRALWQDLGIQFVPFQAQNSFSYSKATQPLFT